VLIKDNIEAIGLPGLAGSTSLVARPARDAPLVTRLRAAGAIIVGSTNLSQWANIRSPRSTSGYSSSADWWQPLALDRSAGGSSSGSGAALAAGLTPSPWGPRPTGPSPVPRPSTAWSPQAHGGHVPTRFVVRSATARTAPDRWPVRLRTWRSSRRPFRDLGGTGAHAELRRGVQLRTANPETDRLFDDVVVAMKQRDCT